MCVLSNPFLLEFWFLWVKFSQTWPAGGSRWSRAPPRTSGRLRPPLLVSTRALLPRRARSSTWRSTERQVGLGGEYWRMKLSELLTSSPATDLAEKLCPGAPPVPLTKPSVVFSTCSVRVTYRWLCVDFLWGLTSLLLIVAVLAVSLAAICFAMASLSIGTGTWSFFPSTPIVAGVLTKRGLDECIDLLNTKAAYKFVPSIAFTVRFAERRFSIWASISCRRNCCIHNNEHLGLGQQA